MNTDTTAHWYPMRVTYLREQRIKEQLDAIGIENFLMPGVHDLIFVHATFDRLYDLKHNREEFHPMQFMTRPSAATEKNEIITIPEAQMHHFIQAVTIDANNTPHQVEVLQNITWATKPAPKVTITDGPFKGIEGTLKSIKKHLCVVITLQNIMAIAITGIHHKLFQKL